MPELTTANNEWIKEFDIDQSFFDFGGGTYAYDKNTGYFYDWNKMISVGKNGNTVNERTDFSGFLTDELERAKKEMLKEVPEKTKLVVAG